MQRSLLISAVIASFLVLATNAFMHKELFKEPPVPQPASDARFVGTGYILQPLDHFNPQDLRNWEMRYFYNNDYFSPGSPMFIYVGGEWEISEGWLMGGHMYYMARDMNGSMFYTEHRYYGKSFPTSDASVENLRFLNVDQALADLAHFIIELKSTTPGMENSPVILVGASYSASMVTWFRQKYPHLSVGAWASSGPLLAQLDFIEYKEVVGQSIELVGGSECHSRLNRAFLALEEMIENNDTLQVDEWFNLCTPIAGTRDLSLMNFFSSITDFIAGVVQYHWPGDIEEFCEDILTDDISNDVQALAAWTQTYLHYACLDYEYDSLITFYRQNDWNHPVNAYAGRPWFYQTCAEYGWYQTSGSEDQPFGSSFPVNLYIACCFDIFGHYFDTYTMNDNVHRTNVIYGGMNPAVTNVFFTQGQLDPWRPMGIQEDLNPSSPAVVIPYASHCQDLYSMSPNDSPEMTAAKERITELVQQWVDEASS